MCLISTETDLFSMSLKKLGGGMWTVNPHFGMYVYIYEYIYMDWWVQFIPKISWSPQLIIPSMIEKTSKWECDMIQLNLQ